MPPTCTGIMPTTGTSRGSPASAPPDLRCATVRSACSEVHVERDGVAVDENRNPAFVPNHFGRGGKRQRRDEDAVSRTQAQRVHRQVQRSRAGVQRDRMRRTDGRRKCFLEPFHPRARSSASPIEVRRRPPEFRVHVFPGDRMGLRTKSLHRRALFCLVRSVTGAQRLGSAVRACLFHW